jgi:hypothetical protein
MEKTTAVIRPEESPMIPDNKLAHTVSHAQWQPADLLSENLRDLAHPASNPGIVLIHRAGIGDIRREPGERRRSSERSMMLTKSGQC